MPVNPTNKDARDRLKTEKKISAEQQRQRDVASDFRNIQNEIKDSLHNMTLSQQQYFRTTIQTKDIIKSLKFNRKAFLNLQMIYWVPQQ